MAGRNAIGIDIGGTHIRAARVSPEGEILARARIASAPDPHLVLERIEALAAELDDGSVAAMGVGVPGRVDFGARRVLSGGYVDLSRVPLAEHLEARFGWPVTVDNDCSMALVAEARVGAGRGAENIVMLTIGTGIGGAILEGGRLLRSRGTAGQLGHILVDPAGEPCLCGKRGCVETVSSGTALGRHIARAGLPAGTSAAELLARRAGGDEVARGVLQAWAGPLRHAIDDLVAILDPELVLLGGGLGEAAFAALSGIEKTACWYDSPVAPARLGDDAGVIGAALAALPERSSARKRLVLVNGVPASGKSGVARALSDETGWPILSIDTVKNPFLAEIEGVDRPFNRKLGRASMAAMFALAREAPEGTTFILDAWFGFQPRDFLDPLLADAGVGSVVELWCSAPPETIGARYAARVADRPVGHPGLDYVPELIALAARARPLDLGPRLDVDTTTALDAARLKGWVLSALDGTVRPSLAA
ncbi:transcriptional regulator [Aureimonas ureilytica]|uniref:Transcriptional regulator n=1 Tax=Aureimonas ureilytica TaxID=401562 RepID=A0A175RAQ5_9HYPH|nr:ROK family protein [Aureimonas ureilytica]KTQ97265.1 transcriptional regulator [Aureimonas ureilytica]